MLRPFYFSIWIKWSIENSLHSPMVFKYNWSKEQFINILLIMYLATENYFLSLFIKWGCIF